MSPIAASLTKSAVVGLISSAELTPFLFADRLGEHRCPDQKGDRCDRNCEFSMSLRNGFLLVSNSGVVASFLRTFARKFDSFRRNRNFVGSHIFRRRVLGN